MNTGPIEMGYVNGMPVDGIQGYTASSFYQGTITPMDKELLTEGKWISFAELQKQKYIYLSISAMDTTWDGKEYNT